MATQKELDALMDLVRVATEVNASNKRVNVEVDICSAQVTVKISDPVKVLANCDAPRKWNWLYYGGSNGAYFSSDIFSEDEFIDRCQEYVGIIKGYDALTADEVAQ